jgi:hypothetical protein
MPGEWWENKYPWWEGEGTARRMSSREKMLDKEAEEMVEAGICRMV